MKKKLRRLALNRETLRVLDNLGLRPAIGVATTMAACLSARGDCTTWRQTDCGECNTGEVCFCDDSLSCTILAEE